MKIFLVYTNGKIVRELFDGEVGDDWRKEVLGRVMEEVREEFKVANYGIYRVMSDYRDIELVDFGSHLYYLQVHK